jgi:hypothetical protein
MSNENAVWYQMRLLLLARDLFDQDGARALERLWAFGLKQAARVQRPEDYYREHGTLDGWSATMHARDLEAELNSEVSSTLARAVADWPLIHGTSGR